MDWLDLINVGKISGFVESLYARWLRSIIFKAINDPDDKWDDKVMEVLDEIFDYKEEE